MTTAIHAEWTKLRTIAGAWWLMVAAAVATVGASALIIAATHVSPGGADRGQDPTKLTLIGVDVGQAAIALLAVLAVTDEYGCGTIRVTLAAIPRRAAMLAAKAINVAGLTLLIALPAVAGCLIAGRLLLPAAGLDRAHGYPLPSLADGPTLRAACGSVIYLGLIALLGLGIGAIVRDTAASAGIVLALLYLPPLLAQLVSGPWRRHIQQIAPMPAGLAIQATHNIRALPIAPWTGLGVTAGWAAAALLASGLLLRLRDA